jgi:hypothetical protein
VVHAVDAAGFPSPIADAKHRRSKNGGLKAAYGRCEASLSLRKNGGLKAAYPGYDDDFIPAQVSENA